VSHSFSEGGSHEEITTGWHCDEKINRLCDSSLVLGKMAQNPAFHACSAILNSSFHAYSAIVDSFVIACFYAEEHYMPQH